MDEKDIAELAYKNGYEKGKKDAVRWIPVAERLPEMQTFTSNDPNDFWEYECSGMVLAYNGKYVLMVECGRDESGVWWTEDGGTCHRDVTHWMPLPEAPKGE